MVRLILIPLLAFCMISCKKNSIDYDVIVVGGGLAGLAAANELFPQKVLVLEKDSIVGGRVKTANFKNKYFYDLGAVFALDSNYRDQLPFQYSEFIEDKPIAFWYKNRIYEGETIWECIENMKVIDKTNLENIKKLNGFNVNELPDSLYEVLNTNMKAVFPGALKEYNSKIQMFAFERYNSSHFTKGNQLVVEHLLSNKKYEIETNSTVTSIVDKGNHCLVIYNKNDKTDTLTTKKVIVATTATVAKKIIKEIKDESKKFLEGVKYAGYYSISVGVKDLNLLPDVSYLIPVGTGFSSILKQKTSNDTISIFQLYIAEEDFNKFNDTSDIRIKTYDVLNEIWNINLSDVIFTDIYFWKEAGVLVNDHYLKKWNESALKPSDNVVLSGDYCLFKFNMPYGMIPAIESGKNAAKMLK